jgi:hypothetical protein
MFLMARGEETPWPIITFPFTPRIGEPHISA